MDHRARPCDHSLALRNTAPNAAEDVSQKIAYVFTGHESRGPTPEGSQRTHPCSENLLCHSSFAGAGHARHRSADSRRPSEKLWLIDSCITQLEAQGPSRTCNESQEEEEECRFTTPEFEAVAPTKPSFPIRLRYEASDVWRSLSEPSRELGTHKTVNARCWPSLEPFSVRTSLTLLSCFLLARQRGRMRDQGSRVGVSGRCSLSSGQAGARALYII